ncbi:MAG: hypothetical protein WCV79_01555 [Candidatus Paceibacterota bacterium]
MSKKNNQKGIILIDILMALSLAALVLISLGIITENAHSVFVRAKERNKLLDEYRNSSSIVYVSKRKYGNNLMESQISVSNASGTDSTSRFIQLVNFTSVNSLESSQNADLSGSPLCTPDFFRSNVVGSYQREGSYIPLIREIVLPVIPGIPLTDLEVRNSVAYISADSSSASDPDLYIFDLKGGGNPTLLSSINTGPGISSFVISGKRVYAAARSTAAELHIIRLDSLTSPTLENKYRLLLPYATATAPFGSSIFINNKYIFIGTEKWDGEEFAVLDVQNSINITKLSGWETNSKINSVYYSDGFIYLASSDQKQLRVLKIDEQRNITEVGSFSPSGWQRQEGKNVSIFEDGVSFTRTSGGFDLVSDHELFSFASTSSTTLSFPVSINIPGGVYGAVQDRYNTYASTRDINREFRIFRSLPSEGSQFASSTSYSLPIAPQSMTCDNDKIYILSHSSPTIYEITFQ